MQKFKVRYGFRIVWGWSPGAGSEPAKAPDHCLRFTKPMLYQLSLLANILIE